MTNDVGGWTQELDAVARRKTALVAGAWARALPRTRLGGSAELGVGGTFRSRTSNKLLLPCKTSGEAAVYGMRSGSIRKKIIGRGMRAIVTGVGVAKQIRPSGRAFALLQEQPRQHGGRVFFLPTVDQSDDFLPQIRGVRETRQFKTLQGAPRSR